MAEREAEKGCNERISACPCTEQCPLETVLSLIGGKWKMRILCVILQGQPIRYNQIKRLIPQISPTMLSQSLNELTEHGLVERTAYAEKTLRVEYSLTEAAIELVPLMVGLRDWGIRHKGMLE